MSTTIIASIASILAVVLPMLEIEIGSDELTTTITTIVVVVGGLWTWKERVSKGDVTALGVRKN